VAARLLPSFGGPSGARVALLEVARGVRKRAFTLSSFSFWLLGSPPGVRGGGVGEGGSRLHASGHLSDDSCAGGDDFHERTIGSVCLALMPTLCDVSCQQNARSRCFGKKGFIKAQRRFLLSLITKR
jgi:hypothetical protein